MKETFKNNLKITVITVLAIAVFICGYLYLALNGYIYGDTQQENAAQTQTQQKSE